MLSRKLPLKKIQKTLKIDYDKEHDILYISINKPTPSYSNEEGWKGVFIRREIDSDIITGATILDYSKRSINSLKKHIPFNVDFHKVV
ncbi:MAG: DUF2283 domain-containing protein [Clostridiales bacterium]|nr:DUF2283 domain-containing protein [Clostridiales bacterium]MCF8023087.1 DUF2283 domain-containing protein [Clostridiales bacterium]